MFLYQCDFYAILTCYGVFFMLGFEVVLVILNWPTTRLRLKIKLYCLF